MQRPLRRRAKEAGLTRAEPHRQTMLAMIDKGGYVDTDSGKTV